MKYQIRLVRTVRQSTVLICSGETPEEAVSRANDYAQDGLAWQDDDNDIGVFAPFECEAVLVEAIQE